MGFRNYLIQSLKTAITISKIRSIKEKVITKYHLLHSLASSKYKQVISKSFTKLHRYFYKDNILDLASDLSIEEQEVAAVTLAEVPIEIFDSSFSEEYEFETTEDLRVGVNKVFNIPNLPYGSRVSSLIVSKG